MSILDWDIGMVLFKAPTVEKHATPEAPHMVVPVEKMPGSLLEGTVWGYFIPRVVQYVIHVLGVLSLCVV